MRLPRWTSRGPAPQFSIVICSINEEKYRRITANYAQVFSATSFEIIGIHDARSLSEAYSRATQRARGEFIIFSHDDIRIVTPDFASRLIAHFSRFDLIGIAGTTHLVGGAWFLAGDPYDYQLVTSPHREPGQFTIVVRGRGSLVIDSIQALDGLFIATRTKIAREVGFDPVTFDHFHLYDLDFTYRAHLAGYRLGVCRDLFIIHESHGNFDDTWATHKRRFEIKFRGHLGHMIEEPRPSHIRNVVFDAAILRDTSSVIELCAPETLISFIPS